MLRSIRGLRCAGVFLLVSVLVGAGAANGQTTSFTYQGQLSDAGSLANSSYDLRFALFDSMAGGAQIGANQTVSAVPVTNGVFTVQLDFGVNAFPGANRFVEVGVRPAGAGSFTTLAPRQQISSSPYSIRTLSAGTADALSSACVGCVTNAQIQTVAGSKVSGTIPAASVPTGSGNYIQNTTALQAGSNFNISGKGTVAGVLSAGSVGVGTASPTAGVLLEVNGTTKLTPGGSGGFIQFGTPGGGTGLAIIGSNRADMRFDGGTLQLVAGLGPGSAPSTNGVAVTTAGTVGIGTTSPSTGQLHVQSNNVGLPAIYAESANRGVWGKSTGSSRGVYGESVSGEGVFGISTSGIGVSGTSASANLASPGVQGRSTANGGVGVRGDATTGVYGMSTSNSGVGVYGEATMGNAVYGRSHQADFAAVAAQNDQGGYAMYAAGSAGQARGSGGWVKAMALINRDGGVVRCYNSQLAGSAASTVPCGITAHLTGSAGAYTVTFNFQIDDRFVLLTASKDTDFMVANIGTTLGNTVYVHTALNSETNGIVQNSSPAQFTIFIF